MPLSGLPAAGAADPAPEAVPPMKDRRPAQPGAPEKPEKRKKFIEISIITTHVHMTTGDFRVLINIKKFINFYLWNKIN